MAAVLILFSNLLVQPDEKGTAEDPRQIAEALRITSEAAAKYEFALLGDKTPFVLRPEPILRWSNPSQGSIFGNVFLWTDGDRPAVVGSLHQWFSPFTHMSHEFHALTTEPLVGKRSGRQVWTTSGPGVQFHPVPQAPDPAQAITTRLVQMRQIARGFTATKRERNETAVQELRLLPRPVYRYKSERLEVVDGALFAFVQGTDPELFLWLEARTEGESVRWSYALLRMNSIALKVQYADADVWSAEELPWGDVSSHKLPYTTYSSKRYPLD